MSNIYEQLSSFRAQGGVSKPWLQTNWVSPHLPTSWKIYRISTFVKTPHFRTLFMTFSNVNNFLAVQNLKVALKKANISQNTRRFFSLTLLRVYNVRMRVRKNAMANQKNAST